MTWLENCRQIHHAVARLKKATKELQQEFNRTDLKILEYVIMAIVVLENLQIGLEFLVGVLLLAFFSLATRGKFVSGFPAEDLLDGFVCGTRFFAGLATSTQRVDRPLPKGVLATPLLPLLHLKPC